MNFENAVPHPFGSMYLCTFHILIAIFYENTEHTNNLFIFNILCNTYANDSARLISIQDFLLPLKNWQNRRHVNGNI